MPALAALALAGIVLIALWPYLWADPLRRLYGVLRYFASIGRGHTVFFEGRTYLAGETLPWRYALTYLVFTTPLVTLALAGLGVVRAVRETWWGENSASALWLIWLGASLGRVSLPGMVIYDGLRQIMEVLPALCLLAGLGGEWVWDAVQGAVARWSGFRPGADCHAENPHAARRHSRVQKLAQVASHPQIVRIPQIQELDAQSAQSAKSVDHEVSEQRSEASPLSEASPILGGETLRSAQGDNGGYAQGDRFTRSWFPAFAGALLIALLLLPQIAGLVRLHPYEGAFFNLLAGGPGRASESYTLEYWGQSYRDGADWLNRNAGPAAWVAVPGCGHIARFSLRPDLRLIVAGQVPQLAGLGGEGYVMFMRDRDYYAGPDTLPEYCESRGQPVYALNVAGARLLSIYRWPAAS